LLPRVHIAFEQPPTIQRVHQPPNTLALFSKILSSYLCVVPDANAVYRVIMRHAVPNSPDRIKMIGAALKSCKFPIKRVRMLSLLTRHGFNEEETMFVEQQRCFESAFFFSFSRLSTSAMFVDFLSSGELAGHPEWQDSEFVSISMQANANTKFNWANQGETHNAVCNAMAWLRYCSWILKCFLQLVNICLFLTRDRRDLRAWMEASSHLDEVLDAEGFRTVLISNMRKLEDECRVAMQSCEYPSQVVLRGSISTYFTRLGWFNPDKPGPYASIRYMMSGIFKLLGSLKPIAVALYTSFAAAADQARRDALKEHIVKFESLCQSMNVYHRLVSSQYPSGREGEVLPRTSELALLAALDRMLGVSSLMNCKSGCDRAGLVRVVVLRMRRFVCDGAHAGARHHLSC
jgi:hypothetical protein